MASGWTNDWQQFAARRRTSSELSCLFVPADSALAGRSCNQSLPTPAMMSSKDQEVAFAPTPDMQWFTNVAESHAPQDVDVPSRTLERVIQHTHQLIPPEGWELPFKTRKKKRDNDTWNTANAPSDLQFSSSDHASQIDPGPPNTPSPHCVPRELDIRSMIAPINKLTIIEGKFYDDPWGEGDEDEDEFLYKPEFLARFIED